MILPQARLLALVAPHLPPALIGPEAIARVAAFTARLPAAFTWGGLELRLVPDDERVDFFTCAASWEGSRAALAAALAAPSPETAMLGSLAPLLAAWAAGRGRLAEMPHVLLEYDEPGAGAAAPFAFLSTDPDHRAHAARRARPLDELLALAHEGLTLALGQAPDAALFAGYARCARLLPTGGRIATTAALQPRGRHQLRLDAALPYAELVPWLDAIGWAGARARLPVLLELMGPGWSRNNVQLDIGPDAVGAAIGLLYRPPAGPRQAARWQPLLGQLVALGACTADKARAVTTWLGAETVTAPDLPWPLSLQRDLDFKLTLLADGRIEAKAYLSYHAQYSLLG